MFKTTQFWPESRHADQGRNGGDGTRRRAAGVEKVLPETAQMLARLPIDAYPYWTLRRYPHTLNAIARRCKEPGEIVRAVDALLHCDRPGRQGFPVEVFLELLEIAHAHGSRSDTRTPTNGFFGYNVCFGGDDVLMRAAFSRAGRTARRAPPCRARARRDPLASAAPNATAQRRESD